MDWDTFVARWNDRRLRIVFVLTALLAGFIVLQVVWGYMA
jgi:hypothetical protein